jgi:hypothetical protein
MAFPNMPSYSGSKAQSSQGTGIWVNPTNASPPVWVFIGEAMGAKFSDKTQFDDSSNLQSTQKEFLPILPDPGKLSVTLNRVSTDAGQAALAASKAAQTRLQYAVVFPINTAAGQSSAGDQRLFLAYVESLSPQIEVNKKITSAFDLQITGPITEIEGS